MKYSTITLTHNRVDSLESTVNSVMCAMNGRDDVEYIVIDMNSYSTSVPAREQLDSLLDQFERDGVKVIRHNENLGPVGRNLGLEIAQGEFIVCVDDDVIVYKEIFDTFDEYFDSEQGESIGAVGQCGMYFRKDWSNYTNGFANLGYECDVLMGFCWCFRNKGYAYDVGDSMWHEEAEMSCQIASDGYYLVRCPDVALHLPDQQSLSCTPGGPVNVDWEKHDGTIALIKDRWYMKLKDYKTYGINPCKIR